MLYDNHKTLTFVNCCSYCYLMTRQKEQTIDLLSKFLKSCRFILWYFNTGKNRKTYIVIIKPSFPIVVLHTIRLSRDKRKKTIDLLYKLLKSFAFILKSFKSTGNWKRYMVIIKRSLFIMVVHTIRSSRDKRNKPLISCINYLNLSLSY